MFCTSTIEEKVYQQSLDLENSLLAASSTWKGIFPPMRGKSVFTMLQIELERDNVGEIITPMGKVPLGLYPGDLILFLLAPEPRIRIIG